jgi:hypothetical protein
MYGVVLNGVSMEVFVAFAFAFAFAIAFARDRPDTELLLLLLLLLKLPDGQRSSHSTRLRSDMRTVGAVKSEPADNFDIAEVFVFMFVFPNRATNSDSFSRKVVIGEWARLSEGVAIIFRQGYYFFNL